MTECVDNKAIHYLQNLCKSHVQFYWFYSSLHKHTVYSSSLTSADLSLRRNTYKRRHFANK